MLTSLDDMIDANSNVRVIDAYRRRQELSEHVFGSVKRQLGFPMLNVCTKEKVEGEVSLLFLGYNLKRAINIIGNAELIQHFKAKTNALFKQTSQILLQFCWMLYNSKIKSF